MKWGCVERPLDDYDVLTHQRQRKYRQEQKTEGNEFLLGECHNILPPPVICHPSSAQLFPQPVSSNCARLAERRSLRPFGLFTMLRFVKEPGFGLPPQKVLALAKASDHSSGS